jgi:hypothetical protein
MEQFKNKMNENKETFHYTYSAKQQEEIRRIREKYVLKEENQMERLRRLDASTTKPGTVIALAVGIVSALVLGVGMCCTMVWADRFFVSGIIIGLIGMAGVGSAYPLYQHITRKQREKLAPEIMRLTEELS